MTIDYRIRNIVIATVLAAAAVLLTVIYVTSARNDVTAGNENVTVYVPSKDYAVGTAGSTIAGNLDKQTVARKNAAPEAVTNPALLKGLYLTQPVYKGEQLTLNRFALPKEQGIRAELKGNQRALQVPGTSDQVLAGTLNAGDRVDVVATPEGPARQHEREERGRASQPACARDGGRRRAARRSRRPTRASTRSSWP